ncbi:MAG: hypothetical protein AVDCRST_MAG18-3246 [uncultured Thermomicrobiales bacterium]|uniref:Uncharacterized protein n=1 Tax=uncultured Thermomicrobiales bacterium TaxID=1645740 RepID=A0A6J4VLT6_9BACT|nr:MAG: hypothetical protein AVDCRST_MAG18-3246 [uncultured Thermomicrobiales bacterium]
MVSAESGIPEPTLTAEQRQLIADTLAERGALGACPACHENSWVLGHGHSLLTLGVGEGDGAGLPTVSRICANCGYLSLHATAVLGL